MKTLAFLAALLALGLSGSAAPTPDPADAHWPQWRGPLATGAAPLADPPVEWSETENVRWKTPLPGRGHSTPIVWGDRVFVTTAVPYGEPFEARHPDAHGAHDNLPVTHRHEFVVMAIDRADGSVVWRKVVARALPREMGHETASLASASPATDGERVFAFFGSYGLYALDLDGEVLWTAHFGDMETKHGHGEGSSPVLHDETIVVNWDHEGGSFVTALDKRTGETKWRRDRDEVTSWATPIVVEHQGEKQVIVPGTSRVRAYDLETGEVVWRVAGLSANIVASPVAGGGRVFTGSSYETRALLAIRLDSARGDLTGSEHVVWRRTRTTPYVPSLLLTDEALYFLGHYQGILSRVDAATGEDRPGTFRLPPIGNVYASPVAAAGRVYIVDRDGTTLVLSDEPEPRVLAVNQLDGTFDASPALAGGDLFLRSDRALYRLSSAATTTAAPPP